MSRLTADLLSIDPNPCAIQASIKFSVHNNLIRGNYRSIVNKVFDVALYFFVGYCCQSISIGSAPILRVYQSSSSLTVVGTDV